MTSRRTVFSVLLILALVAFGVFLGVQWQSPPPRLPASHDELCQRGMQGIRTRDAGEIRRAWEGLQSSEKHQDQAQLLRGALNLFSDQPEVALQDFAKLNPAGPFRDPLLTLTGEALYRVGQLENAERCLSLAVQDSPDNVDALRWRATVAYDLGDIDTTFQTLGEVSRVAPRDYRPHHMRGAIYQDFGEHPRAVVELTRALELAAGASVEVEMRRLLASSLMSLKQFDAALLTLEECPATPITLALKADCLWQSGQSTAARERLQQAESLGELPASGQRLKARISIELQELPEARQMLESLVVSDPSDDEAEYLLALLSRQMKDESQYQVHLARSESIKALKTQLTELSQQAMHDPANAEVRDQLAALCDQLGLTPLAAVWRTAAASCRRRQAPVEPQEKETL